MATTKIRPDQQSIIDAIGEQAFEEIFDVLMNEDTEWLVLQMMATMGKAKLLAMYREMNDQ